MNEKLKRFTNLLKDMFELDKADLDFGIYRIMKLRHMEIMDFIDRDLPIKVKETLSSYVKDNKKMKLKIKKIEDSCNELGVSIKELPDTNEKKKEYMSLKASLVEGTSLTELETDVYSKLYNFFNRYYDEGDFLSKRRYKEGVYAIPYEGEEVKLYWSNQDQYYIKTSEYFKDYSFVSEEITVHFKLVDASTEKDNNKEDKDDKRRFVLVEDNFIDINNKEINIYFEYKVHKDRQDTLLKIAYEKIEKEILKVGDEYSYALLRSTDKDKTSTLLKKHLNTYLSKNTFDYFIHKNLKKFLKQELDFYIKSEVMKLDDIGTETEERIEAYLCKVRAIKRVGEIIIDFLAQIEDFQKKMWLKKKFVVETNWCITIDLIDETFYPEIVTNQNQILEWIEYYKINEIQTNKNQITTGESQLVPFSNPLTIEFLRQNRNLVLDTRHYSNDFKERLIESIDNLDEKVNGLLVNSENFQALNLLQERYKGKIQCVYIDPPYNTQNDNFVYKDGLKHSSWLCMMNDRIKKSKLLTTDKCRMMISIDDNENKNLLHLEDIIFSQESNIGTITWEKRTKAQNTKTSKRMLQSKTEYIHMLRMNKLRQEFNLEATGEKTYDLEDSNGKYRLHEIGQMSSDGMRGRATMIFPILGIMPNENMQWKIGKDEVSRLLKLNRIVLKNNKPNIIFRPEDESREVFTPFWSHFFDKDTYGTAEKGLNEVAKKLGFGSKIETVKPTQLMNKLLFHCTSSNSLILDYFAGSGTTGHATINLNREDGGNRKYILVEMGKYFNTVTLPRIKKVVYSNDWKAGSPINRNTGISQIVKYIRLESYEDTLNNIEFERNDGQQDIFKINQELFEEYLINYMFEKESQILNVDNFVNPFGYKMRINEDNVKTEQNIDLIETFNYLLGLHVLSQKSLLTFNVEHIPYDKNNSDIYEGAVRLKKAVNGEYTFKTIEGRLPSGQLTLVIWRNMTDDIIKDNAALDAFFTNYCINTKGDKKYDMFFVNGDNNLENLCTDNENWKVYMTETMFKAKMFDIKDI